MIIKIVDYKVELDKVRKVRTAVKKFVQAVLENEPDTFYEAYQKDGSQEFVHIMKFPSARAEKAHAKADYTREFVAILYPLCEVAPFFEDLKQVSSS